MSLVKVEHPTRRHKPRRRVPPDSRIFDGTPSHNGDSRGESGASEQVRHWACSGNRWTARMKIGESPHRAYALGYVMSVGAANGSGERLSPEAAFAFRHLNSRESSLGSLTLPTARIRLANPNAVRRLRFSHIIACHEEMDYRDAAYCHCRTRAANPIINMNRRTYRALVRGCSRNLWATGDR